MLSHTCKQRFVCAVLCLFAAGCYGPGLHSPYGGPQNGYFSGTPYGQPQFLNQPGFNQPGFNQQVPGSYTVPGGVVLPPSGSAPYTPGGTVPGSGSSNFSSPTEWLPGRGGGQDNGLGSDGFSGDTFGSDTFGSGSTDAGYGSENGSVPFPRDSNDLMFEANTTSRVDSRALEATASAYRQQAGSTRNGSARDHSWLRGILSSDNEVSNTFNIAYDLQGSDKYQGHLTLVPSEKLSQFRSGEIVEVRGWVDEAETTPYGKPMYRINSIRKLSQ